MIIGAHSIIYSTDPEADRAFLRDILHFPNVDVGGGWLIFALPPAEVAVHPGAENGNHEFYLMCDDVDDLITEMGDCGVECGPVYDADWGRLTQVTLPGGGKLGIYQPLHARPPAAGTSRNRTATKAAKRPSRKKTAAKPARKSPKRAKVAARKTSKKAARRR